MEAGMTKTVLLLGMVGALRSVAPSLSHDAVVRPPLLARDTTSAVALEVRRLDSLATAECIQRVAERSGFQAWPEVEPVDARVVGRQWVRQADGTGRIEALKTILRVGPDSVHVWARLSRAPEDRTLNAGVGTVRQIVAECPRKRTRLPVPPTGAEAR
jgi:hypothetical protein